MNFILRVLYRFYRIFTWLRYRTVRRLTPAGWMVCIALAATATTGVDTDNTVSYQAFATLLCLLAVAWVFSWIFRVRFSATRLLPRFGTTGRPFIYRVLVRNRTHKVQKGLTLLENLVDPRPSFAEWRDAQLADEKRFRSFRVSQRLRTNPFKPATVKEGEVPPMRPDEQVEGRMELTPMRRGLIRFNGVTLARSDPIGLFRAFARLSLPQTLLILPKRYPIPPIALPGSRKYQEGGVAFASNVGSSDEFVALRDYRRGDPLRHIHWRSWAKAGKPIVREFEDEFFVRHALVLDTFSADPRSEAFEEAVSVAASFAQTLETQESLLDLLFVGAQAFCFTAGRGLAHADQMLEILASVRTCGDNRFCELERLVLDHAAAVSGCICVLLDWDEERRGLVQKLKSLGLPVLVLVVIETRQNKRWELGPMRDEPRQFHVLEAGNIERGLAAL